MKIFFSAGEPSGDLHGANLIRQLRARRADVECVGYGGPLMAAAGCELHADLTALAVMWFARVVLNIHKFLALASRADRYFRHKRPDAVVLIDYPGFNWWIARRAKAHGIPVFYYAPPQIWAWAQWRVKKMRRLVDHVLCSLPFEETWLKERGCDATFVGHPFFDEVRQQQLDQAFLVRMRRDDRPLVTILPGSRTQEVTQNLEWFLRAAAVVKARVPKVRFAVAAFKPHHAQFARERIKETSLEIDVYVGKTPELIHLAECCMAVSGSVSLELLYQKKPTVILYRINRFAYFIQARFRRVKYITLVNLLAAKDIFVTTKKAGVAGALGADEAPVRSGAGASLRSSPGHPARLESDRPLFPEYVTSGDKTLEIAAHVIRWLVVEETREGLVAELAKLKARIGHGGASRAAADYILAQLDKRPPAIPRPHFVPGMVVASSGERVI
jgi:lipid-A-disaccharide synthase